MTGTASETADERREALQRLIAPYHDTITRARRVFFDKASFALDGKHETEFAIKQRIASRYSIAFRSVLFAGSAQLGFSPQKDTTFEPGKSDLDVACIDNGLYQRFWEVVLRATRAFSDDSTFISDFHRERMKEGILRRGMILLEYLPKCPERNSEKSFMDELGKDHSAHFSRITVAVYMNEYAFCWKQASALNLVRGITNAKRP
ncbi:MULTISPECIES: hypothetical protein [unclassified Mesorhizobium]|uniref:hypothetical protein n=1 Tax=unclassified Mesorhizobium TaxID=325217 RepID=UPI0012ECAC2A|nr:MULTISPECIES: hypothetical protein [unclassified Mesorhizobium]WJI79594.1 hypothetical protein NLY34_22375 [Mesorhizobium sp. C374B]WJI86129.1 hypothetical protein NLY42_24770 [Mesorhizobium sp. C372A]